MKKVTDLGNYECIHCNTIEENLAIRTLMNEAGMKWCSGSSYLDSDKVNESTNIVFYTIDGMRDEYDKISDKYTVYHASDFIKTVVTKPTYERKAERSDGITFERNAIGGRSLKEITESIAERKESIKRDESLLRSHRNLFGKKYCNGK